MATGGNAVEWKSLEGSETGNSVGHLFYFFVFFFFFGLQPNTRPSITIIICNTIVRIRLLFLYRVWIVHT